jgi:molecular chaperone Hsp33
LPSMGQVVESSDFPEAWLKQTFQDLQPRILDQRGVEFMCHCNREKFRAMLAMLDREELEDIARTGPFPVELRCHHCNTAYAFDRDEVKGIAAEK